MKQYKGMTAFQYAADAAVHQDGSGFVVACDFSAIKIRHTDKEGLLCWQTVSTLDSGELVFRGQGESITLEASPRLWSKIRALEKLASEKNTAMSSAAAASLGRLGGSSTSDAKKKAAVENGKNGGRPRKVTRPD